MSDVRECGICGEERRNVEDVELQPWPGESVPACPICRFIYDTDRDDCLRCGADGARNYTEVEGELGQINLPACVAGALCDECAEAVAAEILQGDRDVPAEVREAAMPADTTNCEGTSP